MKIKLRHVVSVLFVIASAGSAQERLAQPGDALSADLDNYFVLDNFEEAKFQISFKYRLLNNFIKSDPKLPFIESFDLERVNNFYFTYTQKSFWDIGRDSAPFRDHNFGPGLRYSLHDSPIGFFEEIDLGVEHESNGLDAESSRSWNRIYAGFEFEPHPKVDATLKLWHIFSTGDNNPDIDEFLGNAELTLAYNTKPATQTPDGNRDPENIRLQYIGRLGSDGSKGSSTVELQIPFAAAFDKPRWNPHIMLQYWNGYGENLLEYNKRSNAFRAGILFPFGTTSEP